MAMRSVAFLARPVTVVPQQRRRRLATPLGMAFGSTTADLVQTLLAQTMVAGVLFGGITAFERLPRGQLRLPPDSLLIAPSTVRGAGLGVFAGRRLVKGTVLGTYPGVLHQSAYAWSETKGTLVPEASAYVWSLQNGTCVDLPALDS